MIETGEVKNPEFDLVVVEKAHGKWSESSSLKLLTFCVSYARNILLVQWVYILIKVQHFI
jgi:hypothetical protein